jgi:hypothetical protein
VEEGVGVGGGGRRWGRRRGVAGEGGRRGVVAGGGGAEEVVFELVAVRGPELDAGGVAAPQQHRGFGMGR